MIGRKVWAVAALIISAPLPAMAAEQFDLVCIGDDEPWRYRIDLEKSEWCADVCSITMKLASVTSGAITIQDRAPQFRGDETIKNVVNRSTGEWYFYRAMPGIGFNKSIKGRCDLSAFSGMPAAKF